MRTGDEAFREQGGEDAIPYAETAGRALMARGLLR